MDQPVVDGGAESSPRGSAVVEDVAEPLLVERHDAVHLSPEGDHDGVLVVRAESTRRLRSGEIAQPWHDAAAMMSGPAARALGELARSRWLRANDAPLPEPVPEPADLWPEGAAVDFRDMPVAIARTEPPERDTPGIMARHWKRPTTKNKIRPPKTP